MPYMKGDRLPAERASKLGHLEVLKSELVNRLVEQFEANGLATTADCSCWEPIPSGGKPLTLVFGIDGSMQPIESDLPPYKRLSIKRSILYGVKYNLAYSQRGSKIPHGHGLLNAVTNNNK
ncbi:unnamed protein product [marine sediment metagenome]|uniref:Uncharacterized protein n=1 Tax=marine sediment metagenome TaxID=412755 RepID=X1PLJ4_9ZZZZ